MTQFIIKGRVKYGNTIYTSGEVVKVEEKDVEEFKKFGWEIVKEEKQKQEPDYAKMKNAELEKLLEEKGIEFQKGAKKAELLALLK